MFYNYIFSSQHYFAALVDGVAIIPEDILNSLSAIIHEHIHSLPV
ncbi:hypothetical protein RHO12_01955 [Orbus sturtevantii]